MGRMSQIQVGLFWLSRKGKYLILLAVAGMFCRTVFAGGDAAQFEIGNSARLKANPMRNSLEHPLVKTSL